VRTHTHKKTKLRRRTTVLKIDKDCFVDRSWIEHYVRVIVAVCRTKGVQVRRIQMCNSENKGLHFYIDIASPVRAELANELQFFLGDDCGRVDRNRARIRSGLKEWNKLFERPNAILMTIFRGELRDGLEREFSGRNG